MTLLCYVNAQEAKEILEEVQEGTFGTHGNGHAMTRKILRAGLWQQHSPFVYSPKLLNGPWPFSMWGLDMIGPIEHKASNRHHFILVAIGYFTKWVEVASYSNVTRHVVVKFIKQDLICRYGLPSHIITDNGLCERFKIRHHNSSPYHPKMNGVDHRGKWMPNYEGLYVVKEAFSGGTMILTNMDGRDMAYPVNSDIVKKFYP
ncbi:hypothetical protein CR513_26256, partial [Mucuna pruriens]